MMMIASKTFTFVGRRWFRVRGGRGEGEGEKREGGDQRKRSQKGIPTPSEDVSNDLFLDCYHCNQDENNPEDD